MHSVSELRDRRLVAVVFASIALVGVAVLAFAARAQAAETIYWDNYDNNTLAYANLDGSGGGLLPLGTAELKNPEGMALDVAGGRLFVASSEGGESGEGQILYANLDGSGGGVLNTGAAPLDSPEGVAIDPATNMIYWANSGSEPGDLGSIAYAKLDGSGGGTLNTAGATVESPYKVGIDTVNGRLYWANTQSTGDVISYANLNGSGGGNLSVSGASAIAATGFSVDPAAGRLYWIDRENENEGLSYTGLLGGAGGDVPNGGVFNEPYGMAFDPTTDRFYWGNYNNGTEAEDAIGFQDLSGTGGGIDIASVSVNGPQDPVILKSPIAAGVPGISGSTTTPADLSCSTGTWASYPGSFVYAEPQSYAYQWTKDGAAIGGAISSTLRATDPGSYACTVTGTNQQGSAAQTSAGFKVSAPPAPPAPPAAPKKKPHFKLVVKTKTVRVKAGTVAKFKVKALNQGSVGAKVRICAKVPKKARKVLKSKCAKLGSVAGSAKKVATVKVKTKPQAKGTYKLKILVKGAPGKPAKAKLQIIG